MKNIYLYPLDKLTDLSSGYWECLCGYWINVIGQDALVYARKFNDPEGTIKSVTVQGNVDRATSEYLCHKMYPDAKVKQFDLIRTPSFDEVLKYGRPYIRQKEKPT